LESLQSFTAKNVGVLHSNFWLSFKGLPSPTLNGLETVKPTYFSCMPTLIISSPNLINMTTKPLNAGRIFSKKISSPFEMLKTTFL